MMMAPVAPHVPVLLAPILAAVAPVRGVWLDGTFGAGGYARALLDAGAARVIGVDRDPEALARAAAWAGDFGGRLDLRAGTLRRRSTGSPPRPARRRSTAWCSTSASPRCSSTRRRAASPSMKDGPLDMRMSQAGPRRRRPRQPAARGGARRHPLPVRRGARLAADRPRHRRRPAARAVRHDAAARRPDRAAAAAPEARPAARRDPQLPGAAHRGQRRARRARPRPRRRRAGARARRLARGRDLPFARGPHRQALPAAPLRRRAARQPPRARGRGRRAALRARDPQGDRCRTRPRVAANPRARSAEAAASRGGSTRPAGAASTRAALGLPPLALAGVWR